MSPAGKRQKRGKGEFSSAVKPCYGLIINLTAKIFAQRTPPPLCGTSPKMGGRAICVNIFQNTYVASRVSLRCKTQFAAAAASAKVNVCDYIKGEPLKIADRGAGSSSHGKIFASPAKIFRE